MSIFGVSAQEVETMAKSFANQYYRTVINSGWNHVLHIYDPSCRCMINQNKFTPMQMVNFLASINIQKCRVHAPVISWDLVGNSLLVKVTSKMTFLNHVNTPLKTAFVSENFVISCIRRKVLHHSMHVRADLVNSFDFDDL